MLSKLKAKAKAKLSETVTRQREEFGLDAAGAASAQKAAVSYGRDRHKQKVRKGLAVDPKKKLDWDTVKFVDRYGEEHYVSQAAADKMKADEARELAKEAAGHLLPPPARPRLANDKKPSHEAAQIHINWQVPDDFCHPSQIVSAVVRWTVASATHVDRSDIFAETDGSYANQRGRVEHIAIVDKTNVNQAHRETQRVVRNKRARFVEITGLQPDTEYDVRVSFNYSHDVLGHKDEEGNATESEGAASDPLRIRTAQALLQCTGCGSTLNWGMNYCPRLSCVHSDAVYGPAVR